MKRMTNLWCALPLFLIAGGLAILVGCESETTAPNENPPPLSQEAVAEQAAAFTAIVVDLLDELLVPGGKELVPENINLENVTGQVTMDYRCGWPDSPTEEGCFGDTPATNYVRIFTADTAEPPFDPPQRIDVWQDVVGDPLVIATIKGSLEVFPYNNDSPPYHGTVNGSGTVVSGTYISTWEVVGVDFTVGNYPCAGDVIYTSVPTVATVTFDPACGQFATLTVGEDFYRVDLDTGELLPPE
jgi:hypothetical protein